MSTLEEELYKFNPWWEKTYDHGFIQRPHYLEFLKQNTKNKDIIILIGLRRVGKTSLLKNHIARLLINIEPKFIFYASLDSMTLEKFSLNEILREYRKIHQLKRNEKLWLFLDEVAYRNNIHQELKNLYDTENIKIFATSSSTSILRDTQAMLTGRSRVKEILPLDFNEYMLFKGLKPRKSETYLTEQYFEDYMKTGGMPEYVITGDIGYLDNLIDSVIYKDIVAYYGVRDVPSVRDMFRLLMERAGKQFTINKVAKIMGLSPDTVRRYLDYFAQTYLIYLIERCGRLNERIRAPKKLYAADVGIRNMITGYRDKGAIFENLVYLKIKHLKPCYIYQNSAEVDFSFENTLIEVKYNRKLNNKQKSLFDSLPAEKKIIIENIDEYFHLEEYL